nr:unnamed protein product [Spirometra erinaceieuropaei]
MMLKLEPSKSVAQRPVAYATGQYVILNGFLKGEQAGIVWKSELPTGRCPVGIQYKLAGTPEYPPLPSGAVSVFAKEVLKNERLIHILIFNGKRLSLSHIGNISVEKRDDNIISLLGLTGGDWDKLVLFTGHLGSQTRQMEIKFTTGRITRVTINPSNKSEAIAPVLTFIDYEHAFKCTKN